MSNIEFADEEFVENSADLEALGEIVVYASDWTTETIVSQLKKKSIDINPLFQRRDAWDMKKKSRYIESLILGLPVPQIVLAELKKGSYSVLDGKQRLLTLLQFFGLSDDNAKKFFKLTGCDLRKDLNGKTLTDLEKDPAYVDLGNSLLNQTIRSVVLRNCRNSRILEQVFIRLNTASVQLSPHELRLAKYPGNFMTFVDQQSYDSVELHNLLGIDTADYRMRDSELLTRYFSYKLYIEEYNGDLSGFMDSCVEKLNARWDSEQEMFSSLMVNFKQGCLFLNELFDGKPCRKWVGDKFERRFNRAVFDALMFYFCEPSILSSCREKKGEILESYKQLCVGNMGFKDSIEYSTKNVSALFNRLSIWGTTLSGILGETFPLPHLIENRIVLH